MEIAAVNQIIQRWESNPDHLIMMLQDLQDEFHYLPKQALQHLADQLQVPLARVYHVATFYNSFSLEIKGDCVIQVCMRNACLAKGAQQILDAFKRELNIGENETTPDGKFTLKGARCLGRCTAAPVVKFNNELVGNVSSADVPELLARHR